MRRNTLPFLTALLVICALLPYGCSAHRVPPSAAATLQPAAAPTVVTSAKTGRTYSCIHLAESDDEMEKFEAPQLPPGAAPSPDNFEGTDRGDAKTSIAEGAPQTFPDVAALLGSGLFLPDNQMLNHHPPISKDRHSGRVDEEQHNVGITGFLYASVKESDNDFHCIIGTDPSQTRRLVNVEVSGLPLSGPFRGPLKTVRDRFKAFFGLDNLPGKQYTMFKPPIHVRVTGSIFFDVDHPAGKVGPDGFKPATAWEIHPVSDIEFEP